MAVSVTLDSYNATTGCLFFTITGTPIPVAVTVQKSINGGLTWIDSTGNITSPRCGFLVTVPTLFRIKLQNGGELSNILSSENNGIIRTPIEDISDISFCNSPIHIRLQKNGIKKATVRLWIWNGLLNKPLTNPTYIFKKDVVSSDDNYININISEQIKTALNPNFAYNELGLPAIANQGVFWQVEADVETDTTIERRNFRTSFATLGYHYDNDEIPTIPELWCDPRIHDYIKQSFNFTQPLETASSSNVISVNPFTPTLLRESLNPYLIVYIDKNGLFQFFTPNSKVFEIEKSERNNNNIGHRDPSRVNTSYQHSKILTSLDVTKTYQVETGVLSEEMVEVVRQIVYSPKVYLVRFKGDLQTTTTIGLTIDNTFVTIDDTDITIDSTTIENEYLQYFKGFEQIPVIVTNTDFEIMNRVNNKNKIDFKITFESTNNKIKDIR